MRPLSSLRPVYVAGVGLHPFGPASDIPYPALGLTAVRAALTDAGIAWTDCESTYFATARLGMAAGRAMLRYLGDNGGAPLVHVENASASGSSAFRLACLEVAGGVSDVALAVGVDKPNPTRYAFASDGVATPLGAPLPPIGHFALLTEQYRREHGCTIAEIAQVAVKNAANGARNPFAHRRVARSIDEILGSRSIWGELTTGMCCPVSEGAAAAIVASEDALHRFGIDRRRAIRVRSSTAGSERPGDGLNGADAVLTAEIGGRAIAEAGVTPDEIDIVELHDAFAVEELQYLEALGISSSSGAIADLAAGHYDIGGRVAVSPSGGLLAMGHPLGPTGIGQVAEIVAQLRGEAGARQHKDARIGLAHMVGLGAVCVVHVLGRD